MPEPRPLGNVAKHCLQVVLTEMEANQDALFETVVGIVNDDTADAIEKVKQVSARNSFIIRILVYVSAGQTKEAEELIIDQQIKKRKASNAK